MRLSILTAIAVLVLMASTVWGQAAYVPPAVVGVGTPVVAVPASPVRVVYHYWPTAPVVVQPVAPAPGATIVAYPGTVVARRVVVPAAVAAPAPVVVPAAVYPAPAVIRAKVYYPGQPVRNTLRAILP